RGKLHCNKSEQPNRPPRPQASVAPEAATISGDGVSPAASASTSGSPPGRAAANARTDAGRRFGFASRRRFLISFPDDRRIERTCARTGDNPLLSPQQPTSGDFEGVDCKPMDRLEDLHRSVRISRQLHRKVEGIELVRLKREQRNQNLCFSSRPFVLCGLPVRRLPADQLLYERRNGKFVLQVTGHPNYGVPFGLERAGTDTDLR